jgi:hypothetical protein
MGGRGRNQESKDRWDWVQTLSDNRLENYGKMSFWKDPYGHTGPADISKQALNWACAKEFERRQGVAPEWKL